MVKKGEIIRIFHECEVTGRANLGIIDGSGTPRSKTISARDSSVRTFRPIFQSGTARPTLVGPLGPFIYLFTYFFWGGGRGGQFIFLFCLCASKQDS